MIHAIRMKTDTKKNGGSMTSLKTYLTSLAIMIVMLFSVVMVSASDGSPPDQTAIMNVIQTDNVTAREIFANSAISKSVDADSEDQYTGVNAIYESHMKPVPVIVFRT